MSIKNTLKFLIFSFFSLAIAVFALMWLQTSDLKLSAYLLIAVSIGGTVPVLLKSLNVDPAVASGPILTTITDMCGFFLLLGTASLMLPLLTGA